MSDMMSGVSGAGGGDAMRLVGMSTGLDVDSTVKKMLIGERKKINTVKQQQQLLTWKQEAYKEIIKGTKELQDKYFNVASKDSLLNCNKYSDYNVISGNAGITTATGKTKAMEGTYNINVMEVAKKARIEIGSKTTTDEKISASDTMKDLGFTGTKLTISCGSNSIDVEVKQEDKISDLVDKINKEINGEIVARYSELTGKLNIESKETGAGQSLSITGLDTTSLKESSKQNGQDAQVEITQPDGSVGNVTNASNNFTIDGVNYNITGKGKTTLSISQDADKTFDRIKGFIDDYNALIGTINTKLTEKKNYSYKPLSDEQKKEMKDDEIKLWEEKAKQGILRNDPNLQKMLRELRGTFFSSVPQSQMQFNRRELGLDTTSDVATAGQIKFANGGEEKLKKALKERPDEVMKLFTGTYELTAKDKGKFKGDEKAKNKFILDNSGIFKKINSILKDYVGAAGTTLNIAILTKYANKQNDHSYFGTGGNNTIPDQIYRKDQMIKEFTAKMKSREEKLYKQFSRLETVMNKYNAQAGWLAQQLGGGM